MVCSINTGGAVGIFVAVIQDLCFFFRNELGSGKRNRDPVLPLRIYRISVSFSGIRAAQLSRNSCIRIQFIDGIVNWGVRVPENGENKFIAVALQALG